MRQAIIAFAFALVLSGCAFDHGTAEGLAPERPDAGAISPDGRAATDSDAGGALPDGPRTYVTLSETTSPSPTTISAWCNNTTQDSDNAWFRAFRLSDFGLSVGAGFHVTGAAATVTASHQGSIAARIYAYAGPYGGATLGTLGPALAEISQAVPDPYPVGSVEVIELALSADVTAGSAPAGTDGIVLELFETDTRNTGGALTSYFHLAANTDGQAMPAYWRSSACGDAAPIEESVDSIMTVTGYAL
jgi:hypothetical protein